MTAITMETAITHATMTDIVVGMKALHVQTVITTIAATMETAITHVIITDIANRGKAIIHVRIAFTTTADAMETMDATIHVLLLHHQHAITKIQM